MPWYKVPLAVYLPAAGPEEARERVLDLLGKVPDDEERPVATAFLPVELTQEQVDSWQRLREILRQAAKDSADGLMVSDARYPGVRFAPAAAAELAALEFEARQRGEI
jgi:hypothetical protein